jgi:hypothetical protein
MVIGRSGDPGAPGSLDEALLWQVRGRLDADQHPGFENTASFGLSIV